VDQGSAVTVGAGVGLKSLYIAANAQNKLFVSGAAATVCTAGGYLQGGGHSPFSPIYGLAADNVFRKSFSVPFHNQTLKKKQSSALFWQTALTLWSILPHSLIVRFSAWRFAVELQTNAHTFFLLVFWALRGGGPGSWGVIIDATIRTFPIFNITVHIVNVLTTSVEQTGDLMTLHASHIKDWDNVRASQYFFLAGSATNSTLSLATIFKGLDGNASQAQMYPFLSNATALGAVVQGESTLSGTPLDVAGFSDDLSGFNTILSSRLIPNSVYLSTPSRVGAAYKQLLLQGIQSFIGHLVAGGM
jgi:FAD/FMN-containing dehydrogenase